MRHPVTLRHGSADEVGLDSARIELIRTRARGWVANGDTPSLVLLVARKGVIVLEEAFGILRPSDDTPLRTDSIYPVMSIAKPFTAAAVLCLVEDGLLSLKHPITDYIREITTPGADQVLIADLLTHTSGFDDTAVYAHVADRLEKLAALPTVLPGQHPLTARLIQCATDAPLTTRPGEMMSYCNFGYELLGDIVRRVSGRSFAAFVEARIFAPLGMRDTYFALPAKARSRRVCRQPGFPGTRPYRWHPLLPTIDSEDMDAWDNAAAGAKSAAKDVAAFGQMLLNHGTYGGQRVLSRASVAAMTMPQLTPGIRSVFSEPEPGTGARIEVPIRGGNYSYGLFVATRDDRMAYMNGSLLPPGTLSHAGALASNFWVDRHTEVVGVYLSVVPAFRDSGDMLWHCDHFQDMVHAAIVE